MVRKISKISRIRGDKRPTSIADQALTLMARVRIFRSGMAQFISDAKPILVKKPSLFNESDLDYAESTLNRLDALKSEHPSLLDQTSTMRDKIEGAKLLTAKRLQDYRDGSQPEKLHELEGKLVFLEDIFGQLSQAVIDLTSISTGLSSLVDKLKTHWDAILISVIKQTSPTIPEWADDVVHRSVIELRNKLDLYTTAVARIKTYIEDAAKLPESSRRSTLHELRTTASKMTAEITEISPSSTSKVMLAIISRQYAKYVKPMQTALLKELRKIKTSDLTTRMESELSSLKDRYGTVAPVSAPIFGSTDVIIDDALMTKFQNISSDILSSVYAQLRNDVHIAFAEWMTSNVPILIQLIGDPEFEKNMNKALSTADARRRITQDGAHVLLDRNKIIQKDIESFIPPGSFEKIYSQIDRACKIGESASLDCIRMAFVLIFLKYIPSSHFVWHTLRGHRVVTTHNLQLMYPEAWTLINLKSSARNMLVKSFWELFANVLTYYVLQTQLAATSVASPELASRIIKISDDMFTNVENISAIRRRAGITKYSVPAGLLDVGITAGNYVIHATSIGTECINWKLAIDRMTNISATQTSIMVNFVNRANPFDAKWIELFATYYTSTDSEEETIRMVLSGQSIDYTAEELFGSDTE